MRLIDADRLLRETGLENARKYGNETQEQLNNSYDTLMMYEIADIISEAPAVNRWIPCSERLPEERKAVIVCCFGSDMIRINLGESLEDAKKRTKKEIVNVTIGFIGSDGWYGADW